MKRLLAPHLSALLEKKIVLLMGPRQVGKTTLAKHLGIPYSYYNYDIKKDLRVFRKQEWDREPPLVIFDELHKMKKWKLWLKGIYDAEPELKQKILVTGSARLDVVKKMGDSLAGRFFSARLNPLDLKELKETGPLEKNYKKLLSFGGFPEPFLEGSEKFYGLWQKSHLDIILRQDLMSLELVRDLDGIETLVNMLASRVGSTISFNSLAEDLGRDDKTVKHWVTILENLYVIFRVGPWSKNIARAKKKSAKYYFYDIARIEGDEATKLENLVALSLKKELELLQDIHGINGSLCFIQNREGKEIDFLVNRKSRPARLYEVKLADEEPSRNFRIFGRAFPGAEMLQLVRYLDRSFSSKAGVRVTPALSYLERIDYRSI